MVLNECPRPCSQFPHDVLVAKQLDNRSGKSICIARYEYFLSGFCMDTVQRLGCTDQCLSHSHSFEYLVLNTSGNVKGNDTDVGCGQVDPNVFHITCYLNA